MSQESYFRFHPRDVERYGERVDVVDDGAANEQEVAIAYNDLRTRWPRVYVFSPLAKPRTRPIGTFLVGVAHRVAHDEMHRLGYKRTDNLIDYAGYNFTASLSKRNTESTI
jgi:hypothetical protein